MWASNSPLATGNSNVIALCLTNQRSLDRIVGLYYIIMFINISEYYSVKAGTITMPFKCLLLFEMLRLFVTPIYLLSLQSSPILSQMTGLICTCVRLWSKRKEQPYEVLGNKKPDTSGYRA